MPLVSPLQISFDKFAPPKKAVVVILADDEKRLTDNARACDPSGLLGRAIEIGGFSGKLGADIDLIAPHGLTFDRLIVIGAGKTAQLNEESFLKLGGALAAKTKSATEVALVLDIEGVTLAPNNVADVGLGILLRGYSFKKYKTRNSEDAREPDPNKARKVVIHCADPASAKEAFAAAKARAAGVMLARDLVNEPANALGPVEFAARASELERLGVKVEILTENEMKKLGMGALLGVAQGSARPARLVVMQWNGGRENEKPFAFIGKGVVFDSGGISIKPTAGMEDMKGDMAGAAAVTGLLHTLAARKAKANVVGVIGLVENMVDGNAQRPGDIVTSMSGQTIEVLDTDAEGRLVLADALWYCRDRFEPKFMINLATLTYSIIVALGQSHAGLFSNDDKLAQQLTAAGAATAEKLWRMPLGAEYDRLINSKTADMKNIGGRHGGRYGGAITAAQFLQRFVKDTPWAHLDIAGTAMDSPSNEYTRSWGSGFGVRLLDRLLSDNYES